jgi:hypothetical protein
VRCVVLGQQVRITKTIVVNEKQSFSSRDPDPGISGSCLAFVWLLNNADAAVVRVILQDGSGVIS